MIHLQVNGFRLFRCQHEPFLAFEANERPPARLVIRCRQTAAQAGWIWLEDAFLGIRFPGLVSSQGEFPPDDRLGSLLNYWFDFTDF